jgi:hypothetical protein
LQDISELKSDPEILDALKDGIKSELRQFACEPCDHFWWKTVPLRKEVNTLQIVIITILKMFPPKKKIEYICW